MFVHSHTFWHQTRVSSELDLLPEAAQIQAPTLLAWGKYDFTCPLTAGMRYADVIKDCRSYISAGSHNWLIVRPDEFHAAILTFVGQSQGGNNVEH